VLEAGQPGDLLTRQVKLNRKPIASVGGAVPDLADWRYESAATDAFTAQPQSIGFLRFPALTPRACA